MLFFLVKSLVFDFVIINYKKLSEFVTIQNSTTETLRQRRRYRVRVKKMLKQR